MLPFLAQVQVINVAGNVQAVADATSHQNPHAQVDSAINVVRVIVNAALDAADVAANGTSDHIHSSSVAAGEQAHDDAAQARADAAKAQANTAKARAEADDDHDEEGSSDVTINSGPHGVIIHKSKSHDDIPTAIIPIVAIFFVFTYLIIKAVMAPFTNRNKRVVEVPVAGGLSEQEAVVLEKLQRTLAQMESRVESLETILIDQVRTKEKYGTKL